MCVVMSCTGSCVTVFLKKKVLFTFQQAQIAVGENLKYGDHRKKKHFEGVLPCLLMYLIRIKNLSVQLNHVI